MLTTRTKIALARLVQAPILAARTLCGCGPISHVSRYGINWTLDLREGIDFSIYLLGAFEPDTSKVFERMVRPDMTVLDIGANIGAHTLHLARLVGPAGRVVAFEPTAWAYDKLKINLSGNPEIAQSVLVQQAMLIANADQALPESIPSSWPLRAGEAVHPKLRGRDMSTSGADAVTADSRLHELGIDTVDFIKLDVDGYETDVLCGMKATLQKARPIILMELSPYVLEEHGHSVRGLMDALDCAKYRFFGLDGESPLPWDAEALRSLVPDGASINVIARSIV